MKSTIVTVTALAALLHALPAGAQERWAVEFRANGAFATEDIGTDELDEGLGIGFEGTVRYRLQPHLAAYAGWDWMHFRRDESFAGADMDFEETGYVFGLRFEHPFRGETSGTAGWLRAGGTVGHVEIEDPDGALIADSGHGLGWEVAAGLAMDVGARWSFTPGVRYRALSRDVDFDGATTRVDMEYVAFEVGLARRF